MWKKMEGGCPQAGKAKLRKQKSDDGMELLQMGSSSSIQVGQSGDRKQLHQVHFQFDPAAGTRKDARVHSKQGSRRVGGKVVMQRPKRIDHKENHCTTQKNGKIDLANEVQNGSAVVLLEIKSCLIEKEEAKGSSNPQKHTRYSSNADSCGDKHEDQADIYITTIPNQNTEELFRQISRHMAEQKELVRVRRTNQNCFFHNLKKKLQREIIHIEQQGQRKDCKLKIVGCQIEKHRRNLHASASLSDRVRPKSALSSSRTYSSAVNSQRGRINRPMSCQSRSQAPSKELQTIKTESRRLLGVNICKKERSTVRQKQCEGKYIANSLVTFDNPNSLKPYKSSSNKGKGNHSKDNQKLNQILNECSSHGIAFSNLSSKMRTFEYYCKKMVAGMEEAGNKLEELNEAGKFDD